MKRMLLRLTIALTMASAVSVLGARAQNAPITDSRAWLQLYQQQHPEAAVASPDVDPAQQAIADRIVAVRGAAAQAIVSNHNGQWQSGADSLGDRAFSVQLQRDPNSGAISGHVVVAGSNSLTAGNVVGQVTGNSVTGVVADATGFQIVSFTGSVSANAMSGTYQTFDGDSGTWSYQDSDQDPLAAAR